MYEFKSGEGRSISSSFLSPICFLFTLFVVVFTHSTLRFAEVLVKSKHSKRLTPISKVKARNYYPFTFKSHIMELPEHGPRID